jgi:hypothetical protein
VAEKGKQLRGAELTSFLRALGIVREEPVGRSSTSGEDYSEAELDILLTKGDAVAPGAGRVAEDADTVKRLFEQAGETACFGLTPDGHLTSHQPLVFDGDRAVEQVIALLAAEIAADDKDEALASAWLGLAYHDHDHPADFGGLVRDASRDGQPRCCYLDVKGTRAKAPGDQRTKLDQRAQQRKFGCLAQTVTDAAHNGFAGYPGRGTPGLLVTLLHNPVLPGKNHSGYALGWFFGIESNYQAAAAVWGWGGALGVKLPEELCRRLQSTTASIRGQTRNLLELLADYRDYSQFRDDQGQWDRDALRSTLLAKALAARYLLMHEDAVQHAETTAQTLQPEGIDAPLRPDDFVPGESWGTYFGRKADAAFRRADKAEEERRTAEDERRTAEDARRIAEDARRIAEDARRKAEDERRKGEDAIRLTVVRRRQRGHSWAEIAEDLGCTTQELLDRFPMQR